MELHLHPFKLKLKHTFTISRESHDFQPSLVVELNQNGFKGFGEATSNPYYNITVEKMMDLITENKEVIESLSEETPENFWLKLQPYFKNNMFALCALDMAFNDLSARKQGKKLYEVWKYTTTNNDRENERIALAYL